MMRPQYSWTGVITSMKVTPNNSFKPKPLRSCIACITSSWVYDFGIEVVGFPQGLLRTIGYIPPAEAEKNFYQQQDKHVNKATLL